MVGCVIVGGGASYNLMFYDANKATLCVTPVSPSVSGAYDELLQVQPRRLPPLPPACS